MTTINTHSGRQVNIASLDPATIHIGDIAHALTFLCRGGGHTDFFFPVARHCVYCAREARARGYSREVVLACLLHDASEAYMVDLPSPIKDGLFPEYRIFLTAYTGSTSDAVLLRRNWRRLTKSTTHCLNTI